jgi:nicotinamidase-related amidase
MTTLPHAPALFSVQDAYKSAYPARLQEFTTAGWQANLRAADEDQETLAVVLIDCQHDFVDPTGTLYVPGAQDDIARFLTWFYTNAHKITTVYASLDTHLPLQIFYPSWWKHSSTGEHPEPLTIITEEDVMNEVWVPVFPSERGWSVSYVRQLKLQAKKELMIWPYHTMEGTLGHMLSAPISEAIAWHSMARKKQPAHIVKGRTKRTEYYGIFGAEVFEPGDASTALNVALLEEIMNHDRVYIAGEAKSHCVLESARQLVGHFASQPELLSRLNILKDCTSSVRHPTVDFDALAEEELAAMKKMGVNLVLSTDPVV